MKILVLNDDHPDRTENSVSRIALRSAETYEKSGHEVRLITTHRRSFSLDVIRDRHAVSLPADYRRSLRHWRCLRRRHMSALLRTEIASFQPDIVHAHNVHQWLTYDALRIAAEHAPTVLTLHDAMSVAFGRIASHRYLASGGHDARLTAFDHLRTAHLEYNPLRNGTIRRIFRRSGVHLIAVSEALKNGLEQNGLRNVGVMHNGIDLDAWQASPAEIHAFRTRHDLDGIRVILFAGRLNENKGVFALLKAMERLTESMPNARLMALGAPEQWDQILHAAGTSPHLRERCIFPGWLSAVDARMAFYAADVVTTPSLYLDPFNLTNVEAMAAGKPVVGTIFGGTPEVVEQDMTGYICDPRDTKTYANYLMQLLADTELARRMGKDGRTRSERHFQWNDLMRDYLELFQTLVSE